MSTPMVNFKPTDTTFSLRNLGVGALTLYLAISVPLVILTFLGWWRISEREKKRS
jgi:hypothetical protein